MALWFWQEEEQLWQLYCREWRYGVNDAFYKPWENRSEWCLFQKSGRP